LLKFSNWFYRKKYFSYNTIPSVIYIVKIIFPEKKPCRDHNWKNFPIFFISTNLYRQGLPGSSWTAFSCIFVPTIRLLNDPAPPKSALSYPCSPPWFLPTFFPGRYLPKTLSAECFYNCVDLWNSYARMRFEKLPPIPVNFRGISALYCSADCRLHF